MKYRMRTLVILVVLFPAPLVACLWDSDTLEEERRQFPSVLELITGKFLRHSPAFYEWLIEDRKKRLGQEPENVDLYDDLAVAYEKTGQTDLAIETILKKEKISPGLYETYANLGTFYIHAGRLKEGLKEIDKAIEINPDAHFGREVYQKLLVEYVLTKKRAHILNLPMNDEYDGRPFGFAVHVMLKNREEGADWPSPDSTKEAQAATKGVLGMMRFGNFDSPVLLEALASLLLNEYDQTQSKQLAARALLQASYVSEEPNQKAAYRTIAEQALSMQTRPGTIDQISLDEVENQFLAELAEAKTWYERLAEQEERWMEAGLNPEEEFNKIYKEDVRVSSQPALLPGENKDRHTRRESIPIVIAGLAILGAMIISWSRRHRKSGA